MQEQSQRPLNFEEAANVIKEKREKIKRGETQEGERPVSVADIEDRKKFLRYAINFLKDRRLKTLLLLRLAGYSHKEIAWHFGRIKPEIVRALEIEALQRVKDEIAQRRLTGVPILNG